MTSSHRHGCHNRKPFKETLLVPDGYKTQAFTADGAIQAIRKKDIPFTMSRDCQHDRRHTDPSCAECIWLDGKDADIRARKP